MSQPIAEGDIDAFGAHQAPTSGRVRRLRTQIAFDLTPAEVEDERLADAREGRTIE